MSGESPLFVRLYLDEDVHERVALALRLRQFDVISAHEIGRWGLSDSEQLSLAAADQRTLFSYNAADYLRLHRQWRQEGMGHCGIIISDQLAIGETVRRLLNLLNSVMADEMRDQIRWLRAVATHPTA